MLTAGESRTGFDLLEDDAADAEALDAGTQRGNSNGSKPAKKNWNKKNKKPAAPQAGAAPQAAAKDASPGTRGAVAR